MTPTELLILMHTRDVWVIFSCVICRNDICVCSMKIRSLLIPIRYLQLIYLFCRIDVKRSSVNEQVFAVMTRGSKTCHFRMMALCRFSVLLMKLLAWRPFLSCLFSHSTASLIDLQCSPMQHLFPVFFFQDNSWRWVKLKTHWISPFFSCSLFWRLSLFFFFLLFWSMPFHWVFDHSQQLDSCNGKKAKIILLSFKRLNASENVPSHQQAWILTSVSENGTSHHEINQKHKKPLLLTEITTLCLKECLAKVDHWHSMMCCKKACLPIIFHFSRSCEMVCSIIKKVSMSQKETWQWNNDNTKCSSKTNTLASRRICKTPKESFVSCLDETFPVWLFRSIIQMCCWNLRIERQFQALWHHCESLGCNHPSLGRGKVFLSLLLFFSLASWSWWEWVSLCQCWKHFPTVWNLKLWANNHSIWIFNLNSFEFENDLFNSF